jgi:threonine dehydrogenase-like Zn-dependent dehydrogenase
VRATMLYGAGDVRVEDVPDPVIQAPTDAIVRVVRAAICGSDLHPYRSQPPATRAGRWDTSSSASSRTPAPR